MKAILSRLFNHEELNRKEAKNLLLNITRGMYNDAQIAALLTVFQMRGIKVEELIGFREALLTTRIPIDFSAYSPIDIVGTGGDGKNTFNISTCACFIVAEPDITLPNTATMARLPSAEPAMSSNNTA